MPDPGRTDHIKHQKHFWAGALLALLAIASYTVTFFSHSSLFSSSPLYIHEQYLISITFFLIMGLIVLVTGRYQRKSEYAREATEQKYFNLIDQAADPIITIDGLGFIRSANPAVTWISGYEAKDVIGRHFLKTNILVGESMSTASREFLLLMRGDSRPPFELTMIHKDGKIFYAEANARKLRSEDGTVIIQVIFRDVTERKTSESSILKERNSVKNYLNIAGVMILALDRNQAVTLINKKGCEILGYREEEIVGFNWFDNFLPQGHIASAKENFKKVMSGETVIMQNSENFVVTKDGAERLISWHNTVVRDEKGAVTGTLSSGQDITERRRIEDQLHLQSTALEAAANAIVITDRDGDIVWANQALTDITGFSREEVIGQNPRIWKSGLYNAHFYENLWNTILSGNIWHGEIINRRKDDRLFTEEMTLTPVRNKIGEITHFIAIKADVTERKRLQQGLEQANLELEANSRKLEKMLQELTLKNQELQEAQNQLIQSEKLAAIGVLSSGIAHEIKNPLAIISLSVEEMETLTGKMNDQERSYLQMIKRAADRANNVIIELLSFARVSDLKAEPVDLSGLVEGTFTIVQSNAKFKAIRLERRFKDGPISVFGDRILLEQVIFNLLMNAIDAIERGGTITVTGYTRKAYSPNGEHEVAVLEVADTGCGIEPEHLPRIFEPFFTTKEQGKGTGLGLSTVYTLLKRHHGTIDVNSEVGKGTTFIVTLPLNNIHITNKEV